MLAVIKSFFDSLNKTMQAYETKIKNLPTSEIVKDKRLLKKATNITEQILDITNNYTQYFSKQDLKRYEQLKRKFMRYN